jgi:uncharacterized membrane protein
MLGFFHPWIQKSGQAFIIRFSILRLEFPPREGNKATSSKKSQTVLGNKGRQPLTNIIKNKLFSEWETTLGKNKIEQIHGKPQVTLGKGDNP